MQHLFIWRGGGKESKNIKYTMTTSVSVSPIIKICVCYPSTERLEMIQRKRPQKKGRT